MKFATSKPAAASEFITLNLTDKGKKILCIHSYSRSTSSPNTYFVFGRGKGANEAKTLPLCAVRGRDGWGEPACSWVEAAMNFATVQTLGLAGCTALTSLPASLGNCANMQTLDLGWCYALTSLPASLGNCAGLQTLDLGACKALTSLPANLGNCANLQMLDLNNCNALTSCPDLSHLVAKGLKIHGPPAGWYSNGYRAWSK
jgi:hypothetical protein